MALPLKLLGTAVLPALKAFVASPWLKGSSGVLVGLGIEGLGFGAEKGLGLRVKDSGSRV